MRRRNLIAMLGAAAATRSLDALAQQTDRMRRLGVLMPFSESRSKEWVAAFGQALLRFGWIESKNIRIDYRFAAGDPALIKTYAAELVGSSPDAILACTAPAINAVRQQTSTIPIVFALTGDPVSQGFVESLARPGGNVTGVTSFNGPIIGKWLQLLREVSAKRHARGHNVQP
jgi:putative ABC transport system substrate-binding protein